MQDITINLVAVVLLLAVPPALADTFIISDIRVEGLQRISEGTVFNYLPIKIGQTIDTGDSIEAIRALFKTGFFNDVYLERDGDVLVVVEVRARHREDFGDVAETVDALKMWQAVKH